MRVIDANPTHRWPQSQRIRQDARDLALVSHTLVESTGWAPQALNRGDGSDFQLRMAIKGLC